MLLTAFMFMGMITLSAQRPETLFGTNRLDMTGFWYSNTNNFSFFEDNSEYFSGGNVAFEFNKSLLLGWTWQRLSGIGRLDEGTETFDIKHDGLLLAYVPNAHKLIHPYLSISAGTGRLDYNSSRERIFTVQPTLGLELNIFSWWRIGGEAGYRLVSDVDQPDVDGSDFSSPFAQIQFRFGFSSRWR